MSHSPGPCAISSSRVLILLFGLCLTAGLLIYPCPALAGEFEPLAWTEVDVFPGSRVTGLLGLVDRAVGFGTAVGFKFGELTADRLGEIVKALLATDRLRVEMGLATGGVELILKLHFREGQPAVDSMPGLLKALEPWIVVSGNQVEPVAGSLWPQTVGWTGFARLETEGHDAVIRTVLRFDADGLRPLTGIEVADLESRMETRGFFRWQLGLDDSSPVMRRLPVVWLGGNAGFQNQTTLCGLICAVLNEDTRDVRLERWLTCLAERTEETNLLKQVPHAAILAAVTIPGFDLFPKRSGPTQAFWAVGLNPTEDLEPVLEPRAQLIMRLDGGLIPFFGEPDPPEFLLMFAKKTTAVSLLPMLAERIDSLAGHGTMEIRQESEGLLAWRSLTGWWRQDLEYSMIETNDRFGFGHGKDLARACLTAAGTVAVDLNRQGMVAGDEGLFFYMDTARSQEWLVSLAGREWGKMDKRTIDLMRTLGKMNAVSLSLDVRRQGIEIRAAVRGK